MKPLTMSEEQEAHDDLVTSLTHDPDPCNRALQRTRAERDALRTKLAETEGERAALAVSLDAKHVMWQKAIDQRDTSADAVEGLHTALAALAALPAHLQKEVAE